MDIQLFFGCEGDNCADVSVACGDLVTGNELSSQIMTSLFTDRRANDDDEIPDGTTDPRGWWADAIDGVKIGSRLWLLERARAIPETFRLAKEYIQEALQWLIDDGVADKIDVEIGTVSGGCNIMTFLVSVKKPDGKQLKWKYRYAWDLRNLISCEAQNGV